MIVQGRCGCEGMGKGEVRLYSSVYLIARSFLIDMLEAVIIDHTAPAGAIKAPYKRAPHPSPRRFAAALTSGPFLVLVDHS